MSVYDCYDYDPFALASEYVQQNYPYETGPFVGLDDYQASTPCLYMFSSEDGAVYPISESYSHIHFQANNAEGQHLDSYISEDASVSQTASIDAEQEITEPVQQFIAPSKEKHSTSVVHGTATQQCFERLTTATPERERYIRGGGRKDFLEFCSTMPGNMNNPFVLTRDETKHTLGIITKSEGDDMFQVTVEDNRFKERYNRGTSKKPYTFQLPNGEHLTLAELPWAQWTLNHTINLNGRLPEDVDEVTHLTMFRRHLEGSYVDEDHLSWYPAWNTNFDVQNQTTGLWKFAKHRDEYEATRKGTCCVGLELADGPSTVLPDVPMEMTIKLETVMPDEQDFDKENEKIKPRPKQLKTKTRSRPSSSRRENDRSKTSKYKSDSRVTKGGRR